MQDSLACHCVGKPEPLDPNPGGAGFSAITVHELVYAAERAPFTRRIKLLEWISALRAQFSDRIITITDEIAVEAGRLHVAAEKQSRMVEAIDALIAACAASRGAAVVTRNARDFEYLGVRVVNPWRL